MYKKERDITRNWKEKVMEQGRTSKVHLLVLLLGLYEFLQIPTTDRKIKPMSLQVSQVERFGNFGTYLFYDIGAQPQIVKFPMLVQVLMYFIPQENHISFQKTCGYGLFVELLFHLILIFFKLSIHLGCFLLDLHQLIYSPLDLIKLTHYIIQLFHHRQFYLRKQHHFHAIDHLERSFPCSSLGVDLVLPQDLSELGVPWSFFIYKGLLDDSHGVLL